LRRLFEPLFKAIPDLVGDLKRWGETADGVFIELTLHGHLGGRPVEWTVADRIILEDGMIRERRSYFDPVPLLRAVALRPRASLPLLASVFGRNA
jgi:ketosteroid isomerase-like protein